MLVKEATGASAGIIFLVPYLYAKSLYSFEDRAPKENTTPYNFCWNELTHWGQDKMATFFQMTFSNIFFRRKCMNFDWNFTEVYFLGSN